MTDPKLTPPPELVREWQREANHNEAMFPQVAELAAQWGADQELEACVKWLDEGFGDVGNFPAILRAARRPQPSSLKEQALAALDDAIMRGDCITISDALPTIRRALEALPE